MKNKEEESGNIPEFDEEDIEDIDEDEEDEEEEEEKKSDNPTRRIQVCTLNTQVEITSSDPEDRLEKLKGMAEDLINKYGRLKE